jgi:FkbM family methyltransferase
MLHDLKQFAARALRRTGYSVGTIPDPFQVQRRLLGARSAEVVLDVGANVGETAARYRALFPAARVYCFEPAPECVDSLRARFAGDPAVSVIAEAVSDTPGRAVLHLSEGATSHSLRTRSDRALYQPKGAALRDEVEVPVTTLDHFCKEREIPHVDVLKLDVEGAERWALEGARGLLGAQSIGLVFLEVMFVEHYSGQSLYHELAALLAGFGYSLYDLYDLRHARNGQLRWGNAIFLSEELRHAGVEACGSERPKGPTP